MTYGPTLGLYEYLGHLHMCNAMDGRASRHVSITKLYYVNPFLKNKLARIRKWYDFDA